MRPRLERRAQPLVAMQMLAPVLALLVATCGAACVFALSGRHPGEALGILFLDPLSTVDGLTELALKATPLLLCALGIAVAARANVWNIGAEGQFIMGAIAGAGVALGWGGEDHAWLLPAMLIAGALGGMAWAAIPAFLRTRFHAHEILTSLMLSYVVQGPWRDPDGFNFPQTRQFDADALLPLLVPGSRLTVATVLALAAVPLILVLVTRSMLGFQIRVTGLAPRAARYAGFKEARIIWFTLLLSGGLAGLAGVAEAAGPIGQLTPVISPGYGFAAIIVAFMGRLHPVGILLSSLLMALLYLGGEALQVKLQVPLAVTGVIQGILLMALLAGDVLINYRVHWHRAGTA